MAQAPRPTDEAAPPGYISLADADALISSKVTAAVQQMMSLMSEQQSGQPSDSARQIALALAEFTDQGSNRKRVAPEEMARRDAARVELEEVLIDFGNRGVELEYRLKRKVQLDEMLIEPLWIHPVTKTQKATTLQFAGIPNEAMEPINDNAKLVFDLFAASVGGIQSKNARMRVTPRGVVIMEGLAPTQREAPQVTSGTGGASGVKITGRGQPGEIVETRILGTVHPAARQINGRAA